MKPFYRYYSKYGNRPFSGRERGCAHHALICTRLF